MKTKPVIKNFVTRTAMMLAERMTRPFTMTLLVLLMTAVTAWADGAKTLPYSYGFENNDLAAEGWTKVVSSGNFSTDISYNATRCHSGVYLFSAGVDGNQYLISPEIDSDGKDYVVSFYYNNREANNNINSFQVGYSTTTNDVSDPDVFVWGDALSEGYNGDYRLYEQALPAAAKYVAIKCVVNQMCIFFDDFDFAVNGCLPPENLRPSDLTASSATLTWTAPTANETITGYAYQYKAVSATEWSAETTLNDPSATSATISGLTADTSYDFRIRTLYAGGKSSAYLPIIILTDCNAVSLPISHSFENGMGCWRVWDGGVDTGISGASFTFRGSTQDQYLISPQLDSSSGITVSFGYQNLHSSLAKTFHVGYSSTTDATTAFEWGPEITTTLESWSWEHYEHTFPAGTKYIAVKYYCEDDWTFKIDDIAITVDGVLPPAQVSVTESTITCETATLTWTAPTTTKTVTGYGYQYKKSGEGTWSDETTTTGTSASLSGLTADADYDFRVRAIYDSDYSFYAAAGFTTAAAPPYEQGFEDGMGHWSMVDCLEDSYFGVNSINALVYTGRRTKAAHTGSVGFQFYCGAEDDNWGTQYLISPRFSGDVPLDVSFYCGVASGWEKFQVGYSTTTSDVHDTDAWVWNDEKRISSEWEKYETRFPVGTKFIAIKSKTNYFLYIDDISITEHVPYPKPSAIEIDERSMTETEASVVWDIPNDDVTAFVYQYKESSAATWSAEATVTISGATLTNLTPNTNYDFRVKAMYGDNASDYATISFLTDAPAVSLPYDDGFENGMGGWRKKECVVGSEIISTDDAHGGEHYFRFVASDAHQYLLSPHFVGGTRMKLSFYYRNYQTNYPASFMVGYASNKASITWGNPVTARNGEWTLYEAVFPATTQYVMICCVKDGDILILDDFSFTEETGYVVADGSPYAIASDADVVAATYKKTLGSERIGKHQAWLVPFDYTIKSEDTEKFTFYKINMIANSPSPAVEATDEMWVFVTRLDAGAVLHANMPYVYKPKEAVTDYEFVTENATLKAPNNDVLLKTETAEDVYSFYATYENTTATGSDPFYYVSANGEVCYGDDVTIGPYRWIIRKTSKFGSTPSYARRMHFYDGEGDNATGISTAATEAQDSTDAWYTLDGRRLVGKPTAKGGYVHKGRKEVIR